MRSPETERIISHVRAVMVILFKASLSEKREGIETARHKLLERLADIMEADGPREPQRAQKTTGLMCPCPCCRI